MSSPSPVTSRWALPWALAVVAILLGTWELFAAGFDAHGRLLVHRGSVYADATGNDRLREFLEVLPAPAAPRVLVLGSSQVIVVKRAEKSAGLSIPHRLGVDLGPGYEVVSLAAGGQQVVESMAVLLGGFDRVQPSRVVIGLGLVSMRRSRLRESIQAAFDGARLRFAIEESLPEGLASNRWEPLLAVAGEQSVEVAPRGETVQQGFDRRISAWLAERLRMVANRRVLRNELINDPLRRDLVAWVTRGLRGQRVARSFEIGRAYRVSLDALATMQRWCRARGASLDVVVLPFDSTRDPVPYSAETQARISGELQVLAREFGFRLLDLASILGPEHFGDYTDGSPDGFHFDASGHAIVAGRISEWIAAHPAQSEH